KMCLGSRAAFYDDGMLGRDEFLYRLWGCGHARLARRAFTWDSNMHVVSSARLWFLLMLLLKLLYSKSLFQVGQDVVNMLQAHAKPDHIFAHAGGGQLFGTKLTVCGGSGVAGQRFCVAYIDQAQNQLQGIDEARAGSAAALDSERQDAGGFAAHILFGQGMLGMVF